MNSIFSKKTLSKELLVNEVFKKSKLASVIDWVAELDGLMQCWKLTEDFQTEIGDLVKFKYSGPKNKNNDAAILGRDRSYSSALILRADDKTVESNGGTLAIGGESYPGGAPYIVGNGVFEAVYEITSPILISILLAAWRNRESGSTTWNFAGSISDLEVMRGGKTMLLLTLTNKSQGATQLATVGNVNAFMPNYTEAVWKNKAELV